jgi:hypothetical protein
MAANKKGRLIKNVGILIYFHLHRNSYGVYYNLAWNTWRNFKESQMYTS